MKRTATRFFAILLDALLPKLFPGEIRITDTANLVEAIS